jgi:hypothetical protein
MSACNSGSTIVSRVSVPLNELCRRLWRNKLEDPPKPDSGLGPRLPHTHEGENYNEEHQVLFS